MSKFKVGDKCKVINFINTFGEDKKHHTIGSIITIESVDEDYNDPLFLYSCSDGTHRGNDELELAEELPVPKFKVGDRVRVIHYEGVNQESVITGTKNVEGKEHYILQDFSCYYGPKELELVTTPSPLTNTIITDIKDEAQHKRVQKKLFSMGCEWYKSYGEGTEVISSYSKQILISKYSTMHNGCYNRLHKHITANDFLQEVDTPDPQYDVPSQWKGETTGTARFSYGKSLPDKPITVNKDYLNNVDFVFKLPEPEIKIVRGRTKAEQHMADIIQYYKTPEVKGFKTKPMNNIVSFFNDLTVSAEDKELRKAGLKDDSLNWTRDAQEIVKNLEAKDLGYKNYAELSDRTLCEGLSPLEYHALFTKFYTKLLDTAKKYNRKDEKKVK